MKCDEAKRLLHDFVDGELSGAAVDMVKAHVAVCASCRKEAAELDFLGRALIAVRPLRAPALTVERTKAAIRTAAARQAKRAAWARGTIAAIAAAILISIAIMYPYGASYLADKLTPETLVMKKAASEITSSFVANVAAHAKPYTRALPEPMLLLKLAGLVVAVIVTIVAAAEGSTERFLQRRFNL